MDKLDWKIVTELEGNGRQSFAELGETVGLSKSPCWSRVRALEQKGVISGYAARIDPLALGLEVQSFVEVQIRFDAHAEFEAARSEEHTSELQSLMRISYAVFCLKKKKYS